MKNDEVLEALIAHWQDRISHFYEYIVRQFDYKRTYIYVPSELTLARVADGDIAEDYLSGEWSEKWIYCNHLLTEVHPRYKQQQCLDTDADGIIFLSSIFAFWPETDSILVSAMWGPEYVERLHGTAHREDAVNRVKWVSLWKL